MKTHLEFEQDRQKASDFLGQAMKDIIHIVESRGKCPVCGGYVHPFVDDFEVVFRCQNITCEREISLPHTLVERMIKDTSSRKEWKRLPRGKKLSMAIFGIEEIPESERIAKH